MDLNALKNMDPWHWPDNADKTILKALRDTRAGQPDRLLAVELAGEITVINDEMVDQLLSILQNGKETEAVRCGAAVSLGPVLEYTDTMEDEAGISEFEDVEILISEDTFRKLRSTLRRLYMDAGLPMELRRRVLEASVRAPEDWHYEAVRAAYLGTDDDWRLTAVFCMRYVPGFDSEILDSLNSPDQDIRYEAINAAGEWGIEEAWPHVRSLLSSSNTEKYLLIAAIDAVVGIRPDQAPAILAEFVNNPDEEIAGAAQEALSMAEELSEEDNDLDDYDDYADDYDDEPNDRW